MDIGVFDWVDFSDEAPPTARFEERLSLAALADDLGYAVYHVAEHHFTPLGGAPSPSVWLAALARETSRIRLGPLVYLLPLYNPLRLISEIAMIDHLSGGRMELGVGRGVSPYELGYYGVSPANSRELFEETLEVVVKGLSNPVLHHEGRLLPSLDGVPMELHTLQQPYPPLWHATSSPEGVAWAARHGLNLMGLGPASFFGQAVAQYHTIRAEHAGDPARYNAHVAAPRIGMMRQVIVADTDAEAERLLEGTFGAWQHAFVKLWVANDDAPVAVGIPTIEAFRGVGALIVGSPDTVLAGIRATIDEGGLNYLACSFSWGSIARDDAARSMRLFAEEVMPRLAA
ncbi:MAG: LLM class flavin-dependent oxidoreductase [Acidimicrobiia bacterium]|nr:LLM class flavin-dependent oxidoreductase [Acidimicrobiia bacterium]